MGEPVGGAVGCSLFLSLAVTACVPPKKVHHEVPELRFEARVTGYSNASFPSSVQTVRHDPLTERVMVLNTDHLDVFTEDGELLGSLGGAGDGPGEFRSMLYSGFGPDGPWVFDIRANRIAEIDLVPLRVRRTRHAPTTARAQNLPVALSAILARLGDEKWLFRGLVQADLVDGLGVRIQRRPGSVFFVIANSNGEVERVLLHGYAAEECRGEISPPGCQHSVAAVSDNGSRLVWIEGVTIEDASRLMRITRVSTTTGITETVVIQLTAPRFEMHHRDSVRAMLLKRGVGRGAVEAAVFPPLFLAVSIARAGNDGVLWLGGPVDSLGRPWTILDSLNQLVGKLYLDRELAVGGVSHDGAWAARDLSDGRAELMRITIAR